MSTRPFDPYFFGQGGQPLQGSRPARFVADAPLSPAQARQVQALYLALREQVRVSIVRHVRQRHVLNDGTVVQLGCYGEDYSVHVATTAGQGQQDAFVAYAASLDPAYLPLFDREVIDMSAPGSTPKIPPEPVFSYDVPEPEYMTVDAATYTRSINSTETSLDNSQSFTWRGVTVTGTLVGVNINPDPNFVTMRYTADKYLHNIQVAGSNDQHLTISSPFTRPEARTAGRPYYEFYFSNYQQFSPNVTWRVYGGKLSEEGDVDISPSLQSFSDKNYSSLPAVGKNTPEYIASMAQMEEVYDQITAALQAQFPPTPWELWSEARQAAYQEWRSTTWQAWSLLRDRILAGWQQGPAVENHGLTITRKLARDAQVAALHQHLDAGVADPHLAARFLSLPVLVDRAPRASLPQGGSVTHGGVVHEVYLGYPAEALNYQAGAATPDVQVPGSPNPSHAPHGVQSRLLGVDWRSAQCIFGSRMTGRWARLQRHQNYHGGELAGVYIKEPLQWLVHPAYQAVLDAPLDPTPAGSPVHTDRFLPAGAVLTMVHFEYEVFDRFCNAWMWLPVLGMEALDPLWVQSLGSWIGPALNPAQPPRAVRVRGITTQRRLRDGSWSAAQPGRVHTVPQVYALASNAAAIPWPSTVVLLSGYARTMRPVEGGMGQFTYPSYASGWARTMARVRSLLPQPSSQVEQVEHLVTLALRAAGKGKP